MESQQVVDYIAQQLRAGHSEADLRSHLLAHGWSAAAVEDAFTHRRDLAERPAARPKLAAKLARLVAGPKKERKHRVKATKWTRTRWLKLAAVVLVAGLVVLVRSNVLHHKQAPIVFEQKPLSYAQKQMQDITTLGGAVALYAGANGSLPTTATTQTDGHAVLCGPVCDAATPEVNSLLVYKPAGIKFMSYASGLTAPDRQTLYLVPGAKCLSQAGLGGVSTNPRSMVILYAQAQASGTVPRCVTL